MKKIFVAALLVAGLVAGSALRSRATVEYAKKEKTKCTTCHVQMGAKELNAAGRYYAQHKTLAGIPPQAPKAPEKPAAPAKPAPAALPSPAAAPAAAPAAPAPSQRQLLLIARYKVSPEKAQGYEEVEKEWVAAAQAANLGEAFAWETVQRDPFTFSFIVPVSRMEEVDPKSEAGRARYEKFVAALGPERFQRLMAKTQASVRTVDTWMVESVPELSYAPAEAPAQPARFIHVDVERVRTDRGEAYQQVLRRILELARQAKFPFRVDAYRTVTGPEGTYYLVVGVADRQELAEVFRYWGEVFPQTGGAEAWQKLLEDWAACLEDFEHYDEVVRPDLSYTPSSAKAPEGKPTAEKKKP